MKFDEALSNSPIKTIRVITRGVISIKDDQSPIDTPLIIRELPDGYGRACYRDAQGKFMRFTLYPETYQRIKRISMWMDLDCTPMDE